MKYIKVDITDDQRKCANGLYDFERLPHSFTGGTGNMTGALGEIIVKDIWSDKLQFPNEPSYEYDLEGVNSNVKIDVKSKMISDHVIPRDDFKVSVSANGKGISQKCDWYVFCFITKNQFTGYILGWCKKDVYLKESIFKNKGDVDDIGIVLNKGWKFFNDGYHMLIKDLDYVPTTLLQETTSTQMKFVKHTHILNF
tara:strand:- start:679 stop:1269 length:591 start_codon:yes stop_codon:yes gene_type:complete